MEDDTQETPAPEGAPSAPSQEPPAAEAAPAESPSAEAPAAESPVAEAAPQAAAGLDWGHLRGLQSVEAASPEMAAREDYAQELVRELSARAARFTRSVDESIVLSSDGVLRWLGDPVARMVAGEKLLAPRTLLLADEALAGEEREAAQTRADLWLTAYVRKTLGPLLALEEGAELPEAARVLGAKIAEALGVLERERVRNEVRGLDQTTRGAFRKLGVRFGSHYIHVPLLLKPAPRALCTQLWMLRRGAETGAERLLAFASAGRTSFANDGALSPEAYRVAGFRLSGERVVRVDIVERLADLIRAALPDAGRGGREGVNGFVVSPQMTSLTGCSGEAFASILRSLGFEPAKVSKAAFEAARSTAPTEPLKPATPADEASPPQAVVEGAAEGEGAEAGAETPPVLEGAAPEASQEVADEPESVSAEAAAEAEAPETPPTPAVDAPESINAEATAAAEAPETSPADAPESGELGASDAVAADSQAVAQGGPEIAAASEAGEEIEIWRPAPRRPRAPPRAPRMERDAHRRPPRSADAPTPAPDAPVAEEATRSPRRRDDAPRRFEGKRFEGKRFEGKGPQGKGERPREERHDAPPRRESRPVDPDSPFAKLAALKPLLERRDKRN